RDPPIALNKTDLIIHGRKSATRYVHKMGFQVATPLLDDRFNHVVSPACLSPGPSARPQCPESKWSQQVTDDGRLIADVKRVQQFLIQRIAMGHPRMLAQMLAPSFDDELLHHPAGFCGVFPDIPADRAVAIARRAKFAQGGGERG